MTVIGQIDARAPPKLRPIEVLKTTLWLLVKIPWIIIATSLDQVLRKAITGTWSENVKEAVVICIGQNMPVHMIRRLRSPSTSTIHNSTRYSSIGSQLLEKVHESTFEGYWICRGLAPGPTAPKNADVVIFYLHGGGYVLGHPLSDATNLLCMAEVMAEVGMTTAIFGLRYTLAPRGTILHQRRETLAAYTWLTNEMGVSPSKIVIMGESAGGHLILSFLVFLHLQHLQSRQSELSEKCPRKPRHAFLVSPWCDLHNSNRKVVNLRRAEQGFKELLTTWSHLELKGLDPAQKSLYLNFAEKNNDRGSWKDILPQNTWVSAGDDEAIFMYDIDDFVQHARSDGARVQYTVKSMGRHTWQSAASRGHHRTFLDSKADVKTLQLLSGYKELAEAIIKSIKDE
ncbi:alpha/beta hydrolase fold protein [Pyrenochaeta sp. DS3sAY3a]|nr:alpha/beta hydrolase fold protein [Pyrenochaeta sp. DS3sAY3a]